MTHVDRTKDTSPCMDVWLIEVLDVIGRLLGRLSTQAMFIGLAAVMAFVALLVVIMAS